MRRYDAVQLFVVVAHIIMRVHNASMKCDGWLLAGKVCYRVSSFEVRGAKGKGTFFFHGWLILATVRPCLVPRASPSAYQYTGLPIQPPSEAHSSQEQIYPRQQYVVFVEAPAVSTPRLMCFADGDVWLAGAREPAGCCCWLLVPEC